jgi:hypothetical protein
MSKITVAMASYNHASFVGEAIESVLSQSHSDLELIVVDDGSTDDTVKEIQKFKDPRLTCISLPQNMGACIARRMAIERGSGEYVAILNSDDLFLPGKLSKQKEFLDNHPNICALFGLADFIDAQGKKLEQHQHYLGNLFQQPNRSRHEWMRYFFDHGNAFCHPSLMIRRKSYEDIGYYDPRLSQLADFDLWVRMALKYNIHVLQEELVYFRILPSSSNASAPSLQKWRGYQWEMTHILPHFLKIPSIEDLLKIFPEEEKNLKNDSGIKDQHAIHYTLAQRALSISKQVYSVAVPRLQPSPYGHFGLNTLFNLFNDPSFVKISDKLGLTLSEFIHLSKFHDVFHFRPADPFYNECLLSSPQTKKEKFREKLRKLIGNKKL